MSYMIIKPFLIPIISAFILAYLTRPIYKRLERKIGKTASAITCVLLVILVVLIPLGAIVGSIVNQAQDSLDQEGLKVLLGKISSLPIIENLNIDLNEIIQKGTSTMISLLTSALSYLPSLIITLIIVLFGIFYILVDWDKLLSELKNYIPFKNKNKITEEITKATNSIIYGTVLVSVIQFVIGVSGFYISGVKLFFLLGVLIFFLAFIPGLGPTVVWVPLAAYYVFTQNYFTLIGVLITGLILSVGVDTIVRGKIVGGKAKVNPLIMLIGILGGISLFGIFGFIIGPLILIYTIKIVQEVIRQK